MRNKSLAIAAAILLSAGIAFAFSNSSGACCAQQMQSGNASTTEACCDMPCPIEDCPIPCCKK
ncbi:MAG: hypothetical protein H7246_03600 [Phycisphaerae bacterium]|nr:hypothetical protein [Saprospiraceae bacterium]